MPTSKSTEHLVAIGYPAINTTVMGQARSTSPSTSIPTTTPAATTPTITPEPGSTSAAASPAAQLRSSPFGLAPPPGLPSSNNSKMPASRSGAGSPSHDMAAPGATGRLFPKRAREIQAQEGVSSLPANPWGGPPTSGNSTPLRENIPESPTDTFPEITPLPTADRTPSTNTRRARAGTVPSRFSPGAAVVNGPPSFLPLTSSIKGAARPLPTQTPFTASQLGLDLPSDNVSGPSALLSRLRAGSMPQRSPFVHLPSTASPFGTGIFNSWNPTTRERGATLASIASIGSNVPSSPAQSQFSASQGVGETDVHMRTLDYLGLAESSQQPRVQPETDPRFIPNYVDLTKYANRIRSYSVNNKDKYDDEEDAAYEPISSYDAHLAAVQDQLAATNAAIHNHNLAVQALNHAAVNRPRALTASVLDNPAGPRLGVTRNFYPNPSRLDTSVTAANMGLPIADEEQQYQNLPQAVAAMSLARSNSRNHGLLGIDEQSPEGPTSALWLGSIPTSTTISTLTEMFKSYGPVLSARVLTHKNCGFVNFERVESAVAAKANMNGKEIFPGAGPVRINFAKPPSASDTPVHDGVFPSPSPDPMSKGMDGVQTGASAAAAGSTEGGAGGAAAASVLASSTPTVPPLEELTSKILDIVKQFGAGEDDQYCISMNVKQAIGFTAFIDEIPAIKEPAHTRVHDAPKLRDIRKRIDNQTLSPAEIESIAMDMLPEIAELSSDYLGNTVVQKLFEHCSDPVRDSMLEEIAPHMAEIGVHKNGTWAAQKVIDVCKTPHQMSVIVEHLRPYTVPLFLDQFGNYVLQGCLKFGPPYNDFIFETMLCRIWEIAQGRYGARAMRACLESHHATKDQQRLLAAAIALHSVQLATNANGALLLTWFLDTCTFPQRRTVLSPQLRPYLVHLCTHKVAYLTVLKVINQKTEADARDTILRALFFSSHDQVLEAILQDHACGATLIFKVLTTPFFDDAIRTQVVDNVKNVLIRIKAQPSQGYKRLMDEVGLSTRNGGVGGLVRDHANHSNSNERSRPQSRQAMSAQQQHHQPSQPPPSQPGQHVTPQPPQTQSQQQQPVAGQHSAPPPPALGQPQQHAGPYNNGGDTGGQAFYNPLSQLVNPAAAGFNMAYGLPRGTGDMGDAGLTQPFPPFPPTQGPMFNAGATPIGPAGMQQLHYQQSMLTRGGPPPPPSISSFLPPIQAGFGAFGNANPSMDQFRGAAGMPGAGGGPLANATAQAGPGPFGAPGFGMNMGVGGFPDGPMGAMPGMAFPREQLPQANAAGRRGNVGRSPGGDQRQFRE